MGAHRSGTPGAAELNALIDGGDYNGAVRRFTEFFLPEREHAAAVSGCLDTDLTISAACYYTAYMHFLVDRFQVSEERYGRALALCQEIDLPIARDVGFLPYAAFAAEAHALDREIAAGPNAAAPSILIAAMPKSASSFLSSLVSTATQMPIAQISLGVAFRSAVAPRWLDRFARGGCAIHGHLLASDWNLALLERSGVKDVFVQYRDPREAAWSALKSRPQSLDAEAFFDMHLAFLPRWLAGWLDLRDKGCSFRLHFIDYADIASDPRAVLENILETAGHSHAPAALEKVVEAATGNLHRYNFRRGDRDEWRRMMTPEMVEKADAYIPPSVREFCRI